MALAPLLLTLVLVAATVGACGGGKSGAPPSTTAGESGEGLRSSEGVVSTTSGGRSRTLVMIGDSLAVGTEPVLPAALPGWTVRTDARAGRPLAEGMQVLRATSLSPGDVLAISLFTNDDPAHTAALAAAVRESLAHAGDGGCVIWATIASPPWNGVGYRAANALLERAAAEDRRLRIVPWAQQAAADPQILDQDGIHATPDGYRLRARLYARAAASCP